MRAAAQAVAAPWPRLDRLFNNAAVLDYGNRRTSKQGNEWHLEVNVLAPILLTQMLKPLLENSADAKVITTVTTGMAKRKLRTDQILNETYKSGMTLYIQSKQAVLLLMNDLAQRMPTVRFLSVNPGENKTNMTQESNMPGLMKLLVRFFFNEPDVGSQRIYNAAFDARFSAENRVYITGDKVVAIKHGITAADKAALLAGIQSSQ